MQKDRADRQSMSLLVEYDGAGELYRDYTENLSTGGVLIHTDRDLESGDRVDLCLSFPRLLKPLCISGVVRWVRSISTGEKGVGIEFTNFDDNVQEKLESVLERMRAHDPAYVENSVRVLLCEDNPHVARLVEEGLDSVRFSDVPLDIVRASDGWEALQILRERSVDIIMIDADLPVVNGVTLLSILRQDEELKSIPVIAVSGGGPKVEGEMLSAGADFFLAKPMRLRHIIETMRCLLARGR